MAKFDGQNGSLADWQYYNGENGQGGLANQILADSNGDAFVTGYIFKDFAHSSDKLNIATVKFSP